MILGRLRQFCLRIKARLTFGRPVAVFGNFTVVDASRVRIGRNCAINPGVFILGMSGIEIGDDVVLSARCMLIDGTLNSRASASSGNRVYVDKPIRIEDGAWIGAGAIVLPGVVIGSQSIVGAGSVVTKSVPPLTVVAGNPARFLRKIEP
jgi:maltose O-acetyltransferase